MIPPDLGEYTVDDRADPGCGFVSAGVLRDKWQERAPRRRDVNAPTWGAGGVATQDMCTGTDNMEGLAQLDRRPLESIPTEQGVIRLPYGDVGDVSYMPSVSWLQVAPHTDDRTSGISDRYYR